MREFKAGVERRSSGRLRLDLYSDGQLGQIPATVEGIAMGTVEFGLATIGFFVGLEPRFAVLDAVGEFDNLEHADRSLQDPALRRRISEMGASKGVEAITVHIAGPMLLASRSQVGRIADIRGKKIRVLESGDSRIPSTTAPPAL